MSKEKSAINVFQKYLTVWVILCMVIGILIGEYLPGIPAFLNQFEYAKVSVPMAILIWLMIYPMMMKVDFQSIKNVGKNPKGLFVTWITNWLIKPFTMYGYCRIVLFRDIQSIYHTRFSNRISRGGCFTWRSSMYGNGVCLEQFNKRRPRLYGSASGDQ